MDIDYTGWKINLRKGIALHPQTGVVISFIGTPGSDHFEGSPSRFPVNLGTLEQVRLLRYGYQAYREAYASTDSEPYPLKPAKTIVIKKRSTKYSKLTVSA